MVVDKSLSSPSSSSSSTQQINLEDQNEHPTITRQSILKLSNTLLQLKSSGTASSQQYNHQLQSLFDLLLSSKRLLSSSNTINASSNIPIILETIIDCITKCGEISRVIDQFVNCLSSSTSPSSILLSNYDHLLLGSLIDLMITPDYISTTITKKLSTTGSSASSTNTTTTLNSPLVSILKSLTTTNTIGGKDHIDSMISSIIYHMERVLSINSNNITSGTTGGGAIVPPSSLIEQRYRIIFAPFISYILSSSTMTTTTTTSILYLFNSVTRLAHNVVILYSPILDTLTSSLFSIPASSPSSTTIILIINYLRDLIDLIRFPPSTNLTTTTTTTTSSSSSSIDIVYKSRILYFMIQLLLQDDNNNNNNSVGLVSLSSNLLIYINDLIILDNSLLWTTSYSSASSSTLDNVPLIVVLMYKARQTISRNLPIIISLLKQSISIIGNNIATEEQKHALRLCINPLILLDSTSIDSKEKESYKSIIKSIETIVFNNNNNNNSSSNNNTSDSSSSSSSKVPPSKKSIYINIKLSESMILFNIIWNWYQLNGSNLSNTAMLNDIVKLIQNLYSNYSSQQTEQQSSPSSTSFELLFYFLSSLLQQTNLLTSSTPSPTMLESIEQFVITLLELICNMVIEGSNSAYYAVDLLPIIMNRLQHEESPVIILQLYTQLSRLSRNRKCYPVVSRALQSLSQSTTRSPLATRLWFRVWKESWRGFSHIQQLIASSTPSSSSKKDQPPAGETIGIESRLAAASTILDICREDAGSGQELIQPLSQLLIRDTNPNVLALALDSLSELCHQEVLSFPSAWQVIKKNLGQEQGLEDQVRHPLVLVHLLEFFSYGATEFTLQPIATMEEKLLDTMKDIIRRCWDLTKHQDKRVRTAAFGTLSTYAAIDTAIIVEPGNIPSLISILKTSNISASPDDDGNLENIDTLLHSVLSYELNEKRTLKSVHLTLKQTKAVRLGDAIVAVGDLLLKDYQDDQRVGIKQGLLGGLLWVLGNKQEEQENTIADSQQEEDQTKKKQQQESRKEIALKYKAMSNILSEAIQEFDTSRDSILSLMSTGSWNRFMISCFSYHVKNEMIRASLKKQQQTEPQQANNNSYLFEKEIMEKVYNDLYKQFESIILNDNSTLFQVDNAINALVGLGRQLPQTSYMLIEQLVNQLYQWASNQSSTISTNVQQSSLRAIGLLLPLLLDDSPIFKECIQLLIYGLDNIKDDQLQESILINNSYIVGSGFALMIISSQVDYKQLSTTRSQLYKQLFDSLLQSYNNYNIAAKQNSDGDDTILYSFILSLCYASRAIEQFGQKTIMQDIYNMVDQISLKEASDTNWKLIGISLLAKPTLLASMFRMNIIGDDKTTVVRDLLNQYSTKYWTLYKSHKHLSVMVAASRASIVQLMTNYIQIDDIETMLEQCINSLNSSSISSAERVTAATFSSVLLGSSLFGLNVDSVIRTKLNGSTLEIINSHPSKRKECQSNINLLLNKMINIYKNDQEDSRVVRTIAWCLGSMTGYSGGSSSSTSSTSATSSTSGTDNTPDNLDHLKDDVLIKHLFNILQDKQQKPQYMSIVLSVLSKVDGAKLPIVNWGTLIKRIFSTTSDCQLKKQCIQFTATNITLSTNAINMVEWLNVTHFQSLDSTIVKKALIKAIPDVIAYMPVSRIPLIIGDLLASLANNTIPAIYQSQEKDNNLRIKQTILIWKTFGRLCNIKSSSSSSSLDLINRIYNQIIQLIDGLPVPLHPSLENNAIQAAIDTLVQLPFIQLEKALGVPLTASTNNRIQFLKECRNNIIYASVIKYHCQQQLQQQPPVQINSIMTKELNRIKSWCFSISDPNMINLVSRYLGDIIIDPLMSIGTQRSTTIITDLLDSIILSHNIDIGLEVLSQYIMKSSITTTTTTIAKNTTKSLDLTLLLSYSIVSINENHNNIGFKQLLPIYLDQYLNQQQQPPPSPSQTIYQKLNQINQMINQNPNNYQYSSILSRCIPPPPPPPQQQS